LSECRETCCKQSTSKPVQSAWIWQRRCLAKSGSRNPVIEVEAAVSIVKRQSAWKRVVSSQGPSIPFQVRGASPMTFILPPAAASFIRLAQKVAIISGLRAAVQESPVSRTLLTPMILSANKKSHSNYPPDMLLGGGTSYRVCSGLRPARTSPPQMEHQPSFGGTLLALPGAVGVD